MPTILEIMEIQPEKWPEMDGLSLANSLLIDKTIESREAYSESVNIAKYVRLELVEQSDLKNDKLYSLIQDGKKLIYHQLNPHRSELYDLVKDPHELNNLIKEQPNEAHDFFLRLRNMKAFSDIVPSDIKQSDKERLEKLKSLGYIQ